MKKFLLLIGLFFSLVNFAQLKDQPNQKPKPNPLTSGITYHSHEHNGVIRCHTMEMDSIRRSQHPEVNSFEETEAWIQQKVKEYKAQNQGNKQQLAVLTIPVVVHVIHNGDAVGTNENIADDQVLSQIQVLNEDYRRMLGTNGYNTHADGADVEIEFCMAVVDPDGNVTDGIDRVNYGSASFNSNAAVESMKAATIWDPTQYMNMWSVNFGGTMAGILGYAQFPDNPQGLDGLSATGGSANTDGVVAAYTTFGSSDIYPAGTYSAPYDLGRTMTHEVGHYLGLRHIWGDTNCGDDYCDDTPESTTSNSGCPIQTTCDGNQDMVENYMDYTYDACMNIFTQDQKDRIRSVLTYSPRRASLTTSTVCSSPNPDDVGISSILVPDGDLCATSFTPQVVVYNYGNNTITSFDLTYDIDGGTSTVYSWTGTLGTVSYDTITLPSISLADGSYTFNVETSSPNGNTDSNTANDTGSSTLPLHQVIQLL